MPRVSPHARELQLRSLNPRHAPRPRTHHPNPDPSLVSFRRYHFFFNSQDVKFLVELQAGLTLLGNTTLFIGALLIALSNGWTIKQPLEDIKGLNPFAEKPAVAAATDDAAEPPPALVTQDVLPAPLLAVELTLLTALFSYGLKYIEPAIGLPYEPSAIVGWAVCIGIPAIVGYSFASSPPSKSAA